MLKGVFLWRESPPSFGWYVVVAILIGDVVLGFTADGDCSAIVDGVLIASGERRYAALPRSLIEWPYNDGRTLWEKIL